ncbi:calpain-2 catalytic subunit-like isoform X1 [Hemibagrus wyckioides]|uniref:calpain-2 catalytic subunit-like isoform X1 n=1 Tax=Hemibagrus wyckioides TaxID=337641 RepID=UPI00266C52AE|nr:calpain-2 catalytic subunit-like isoform X1 [Hemibagrus wyckioides]XP_058243696.1 calpain-2 catalytic subunit-like isoform X1 [Hemibagrus wyckioides]
MMPDLLVRDKDVTDSVGSYSNPERFLGQNYKELKRDFVKYNARFLDDKFLPNESSIGEGLLSHSELERVEWIRPTKMVSDPHLVVDSESRFDLAQGELGNCWFLAAIGAITFQPKIMDQIIPVGQSFRKDYAGIFHFRFWRFGKWVDVVIDDKLPTIDGQLIFVHCKTRNEFWPALLEKAYAKVCGSYADLHGGLISEALCDFIGGVHLTLRLKPDHPEHWALLYRAEQYNSCMGCGSHAGATSANTELPNGIVEGHAYTVTGVTKVMSEGESVKLVRLLNPWGRREWKGDWSDRSPLWGSVEPEERSKLLHSKEDGEFWMSVEDFCRSFANVDICCQSPAFLDGSSERSWTTTCYEGHWDENTAGGSMENKQSFWKNPQYRVKISAGETDRAEGQGLNLLVSLMQKPNSRHRHHVQNHNIGFSVFAVPPDLKDQRAIPAAFFSSSAPVARSKALSNSREVTEYLRLKPGLYLIVPFTYKPKETGSFVLTLFSKTKPN